VTRAKRLEELLARYVERHQLRGERLTPEELCQDAPELLDELRQCIRQYDELERTLDGPDVGSGPPIEQSQGELPSFEGFRTIERLGRGGGGEVYKLEDIELGRTVAAKVVRGDSPLRQGLDEFLREARTLALFEDPRIVKLFEFRGRSDPPVLLMEYVEGFELDRLGGSLEFAQRARVMFEITDAIERAHRLGLQHRDLKPANIMLDSELRPRILDFGLSQSDPQRGHGLGTLAYMAPEQIDRTRPIDARADVYALGIVFYELLCGARPYGGEDPSRLVAAIRQGRPRLPVEIEPDVPEPLQAIALKAMERDPDARYASARELALELKRFLEGQPVLARPTLYQTALERRLHPHLEQIREWLRIKLIYPHEAQRLRSVYASLEARDDDWIVESRVLSFSQIALYLGAFLLLCGSLLYFGAFLLDTVEGLIGPTLVFGLPFVGLNVAGHLLYRREQQAVAVAFYLGAVILLPLYLLIVFHEAGIWPQQPAAEGQLLPDSGVSNRQLQIAAFLACAWSGWLAARTRTVGLSACCTALLCVFHLTVLGDLGLRTWLEQGHWDRLSLHLLPLLIVAAVLGFFSEARGQSWFSRPLYLSATALFVLSLELLALGGKAFAYLGLSMAPFQGSDVSDPVLLDTLAAMTLNGLLIYLAGWLLDRRGTSLMQTSSWLLYVISPFAILQPIAYLNLVDDYSRRFLWLYLVLALAITILSHYRQRKSFYYAGLLNTGTALWLITAEYEWFDRPAWAVVVVLIGLAVLAAGFGLASSERHRRG
jgi:serine/threonine protein kinase